MWQEGLCRLALLFAILETKQTHLSTAEDSGNMDKLIFKFFENKQQFDFSLRESAFKLKEHLLVFEEEEKKKNQKSPLSSTEQNNRMERSSLNITNIDLKNKMGDSSKMSGSFDFKENNWRLKVQDLAKGLAETLGLDDFERVVFFAEFKALFVNGDGFTSKHKKVKNSSAEKLLGKGLCLKIRLEQLFDSAHQNLDKFTIRMKSFVRSNENFILRTNMDLQKETESIHRECFLGLTNNREWYNTRVNEIINRVKQKVGTNTSIDAEGSVSSNRKSTFSFTSFNGPIQLSLKNIYCPDNVFGLSMKVVDRSKVCSLTRLYVQKLKSLCPFTLKKPISIPSEEGKIRFISCLEPEMFIFNQGLSLMRKDLDHLESLYSKTSQSKANPNLVQALTSDRVPNSWKNIFLYSTPVSRFSQETRSYSLKHFFILVKKRHSFLKRSLENPEHFQLTNLDLLADPLRFVRRLKVTFNMFYRKADHPLELEASIDFPETSELFQKKNRDSEIFGLFPFDLTSLAFNKTENRLMQTANPPVSSWLSGLHTRFPCVIWKSSDVSSSHGHSSRLTIVKVQLKTKIFENGNLERFLEENSFENIFGKFKKKVSMTDVFCTPVYLYLGGLWRHRIGYLSMDPGVLGTEQLLRHRLVARTS